jgi:hypothetical protein
MLRLDVLYYGMRMVQVSPLDHDASWSHQDIKANVDTLTWKSTQALLS